MLPVAAAEDDAGSGADAPNERSLAMTVPIGTIQGHALRYDADWYRVLVPAGKTLGIHYTSSASSSMVAYEEKGDSIWYASPGQYRTLQPSEGVALFKLGDSWSEMDYTLTLSLVAVPPQDDGGSGRDAGNTHHSATPVQAGVLRGVVDPGAGDYADWLRVEAAPDEVLDVVHRGSDSGLSVQFRDAWGNGLGGFPSYPSAGATASFVPPGGALLVGVRDSWTSKEYVLEVVRHKRADLGVADVEVVPIPLEGLASGAPLETQREVRVEIGNEGPGATRNARLLVYTTHEGATTARRVLADVPVSLAAGGSQVVSIEWDTLGQAGDVTLHAQVSNEFDLTPADDHAVLRTYNHFGGTLVGVELLNHAATVGGVQARLDYGAPRDGLYVEGGGAWAVLGTRPESGLEANAGTGAGPY